MTKTNTTSGARAIANNGQLQDIVPPNTTSGTRNQLDQMVTNLHYEQQHTLAKIEKLQQDLQHLQLQKASRLEDSLYSPKLLDHYQKVANLLAKSTMIPKIYHGIPSDIFVAMAMGYQLGFPVEQALQDIAVINGRPCLWGDGLLSLCLSHPDCEYINEEEIFDKGQVVGYRCKVKRRQHPEHVKTFTLADAKQAGLLGSNTWAKYTGRMLQMRARSYAIRDKFADALRGIRVAEIEQDDAQYIDGQSSQLAGTTQTEKLKSLLNGGRPNDTMDTDTAGEAAAHSTDAQGEQGENEHRVAHSGQPEDGQTCTTDACAISPTQADKISILIEEKGFGEDRLAKALQYYGVETLDEMSAELADKFIAQLEKM
jgi:hypothetical protein